jgi:hypothetical protein
MLSMEEKAMPLLLDHQMDVINCRLERTSPRTMSLGDRGDLDAHW